MFHTWQYPPPLTLWFTKIPVELCVHPSRSVLTRSVLSWSLHIKTMLGSRSLHIKTMLGSRSVCFTASKVLFNYECQHQSTLLTSDLYMYVKFGTLTYIHALDSVQKFALRACSKQCATPYQALLSSFNLPELAARRHQMKVCTICKLIHGHTDFPNLPIAFRENIHELRNSNAYSITGFRASYAPLYHCSVEQSHSGPNCFTLLYF